MTKGSAPLVSRSTLLIALTFDTDPDDFDPSLVVAGKNIRENLAWRGIEEGIPLICSVLEGVRDSDGNAARLTWMVRADDQLSSAYGDAAYLLLAHCDLWASRRENGDEIGWHPHLYRFDRGAWRQDTDPERLQDQLRRSADAIRDTEYHPVSSRIGEAYSSNAVMSALDACGILYDSTAMPGRVRRDVVRNLNWEGTPEEAYHPSRDDYRQPGNNPLELLEIPLTMFVTQTAYDAKPLRRYVDLSFRHDVVFPALEDVLSKAAILMTITHPSAILPRDVAKHGLLSLSIDTFQSNVEMMLAYLERIGRSFRFVTVRECGAIVMRQEEQ